MKEDFRKRAEEWEEKELENNPLLKEKSQEVKDAVEMMMGIGVGYHIDKNGNKRGLTFDELHDLKTTQKLLSLNYQEVK